MEPCKQCQGPTTAAERRTYQGRCEDCWAGLAERVYGSGSFPQRFIRRNAAGVQRPSTVSYPAR